MCAYHRGQHEVTIVVYDDYERDEAPVSYFFREPDDFPPLERLALDQCRGRILDVGAGSGCHSLELERRGLSVTAIEILPGLLDILRQRGLRDARQATWMDLQIDQPYDTVLMMMNGLGLAETLTGLDRFFREARRLLQPDGQVLADQPTCGYGWIPRRHGPARSGGRTDATSVSFTFNWSSRAGRGRPSGNSTWILKPCSAGPQQPGGVVRCCASRTSTGTTWYG